MTISVLQWNIWYKEDIRNIASFLKKQDADIICLQELTVNSNDHTIKDAPTFIAEQLGYYYSCKKIPLGSDGSEAMMLANGIFSRFPIVGNKFAWINEPSGTGGYDDEYRAYVEVAVNIDGQKLDVGTTHMSYTDRFESTPNKKHETEMLLAELSPHNNLFIFTGDLNAIPGSDTIMSIERTLRNSGPDISKNTWTTKPFSYNGFEETNLNWRLDHVFTTKDLNVLSSEIIATEYSDHLPILTKIALN